MKKPQFLLLLLGACAGCAESKVDRGAASSIQQGAQMSRTERVGGTLYEWSTSRPSVSEGLCEVRGTQAATANGNRSEHPYLAFALPEKGGCPQSLGPYGAKSDSLALNELRAALELLRSCAVEWAPACGSLKPPQELAVRYSSYEFASAEKYGSFVVLRFISAASDRCKYASARIEMSGGTPKVEFVGCGVPD